MIKIFDFDPETQTVLNNFLFDVNSTDWNNWLTISTKEEYEDYLLKNSGFSSFSEILEQNSLDSRDFSIDIKTFVKDYNLPDEIIICHTSGTTNSNINALKWFHMSKDIISRYWAPGMQAIFESSGLSSKKSALIFVPSRTNLDGIKSIGDKQYVSLYSSEFSQRTMLSIIKPNSYLLHEYKLCKDLEIISKILSMENIAVISAPAITILGWANIEKLEIGLKKSALKFKETANNGDNNLINLIKREGVKKAAKIIHDKLSDKLSGATIIFSTTSLSEKDWIFIRDFMHWKKGEEKFTNLYVASEVGPIASSLGDFELSRSNNMYLFPLTLGVLENKGKKDLISRTKNNIGKLLVSRFNNEETLPNIDLGDIIKVNDQIGLPKIDGNILRAKFELKYPIKISNKIDLTNRYRIFAGDYFIFENFEIYNPRNFLNCLNHKCSTNFDCFLFINKNESVYKIILHQDIDSDCSNVEFIKKEIKQCLSKENITTAIDNNQIQIELISEKPIDFFTTRSEMLDNVRNGKMPKGILKKWPLYYVEIN